MSEIVTRFSNIPNVYANAVVAPNGFIYMIPRDSTNVLKINPATDSISTFGAFVNTGAYWLDGVLAGTDIYCIPYNAPHILKIDTLTDTVSTFDDGGLPGAVPDAEWSGGVLAPNGLIYCVPNNNQFVLIIDPAFDSLSTIDSLNLSADKTNNCVLAPNGLIFGVPNNLESVMIVNTNTNSISYLGTDFPNGDVGQTEKWAGGILGPDGYIYFFPYNRNSILQLNPYNYLMQEFGNFVGAGKWAGGSNGPNGLIYGMPFDRSYILRINPSVVPTADEFYLTQLLNNKWTGSIFASESNSIYGVPTFSTQILKIEFAPSPTVVVIDHDVAAIGKTKIINKNFKTANSGMGRTFIAPDKLNYYYNNCMRLESVTKSYGEVNPIYNNHEIVGVVKTQEGLQTGTLIGKMPYNFRSYLEQLSEKKCFFDLQIHFGVCNNPSSFNEFNSGIILENVFINNYSTTGLVSTSPDTVASIEETVTISFRDMHVITQIQVSEIIIPPMHVTPVFSFHGNIMDITDVITCEDCNSDCQGIFILERNASGHTLLYSADQGDTWKSELIPNSIQITSNTPALTVYKDYVYVLVSDSIEADRVALYRRHIYDLLNNRSQWQKLKTSPFSFTNISKIVGFNNKIYAIKGSSGDVVNFVYDITTNQIETNVLPYPSNDIYNDVFVYNEQIMGIVEWGDPNVWMTFDKGASWRLFTYTTDPISVTSSRLAIKSESEWFVTTGNNNTLYYTSDKGRTWSKNIFTSEILPIAFSNLFIGLIGSSNGNIYRTVDGGITWIQQDSGTNSQIRKILTCSNDLSFNFINVTSENFRFTGEKE